MTPAPGLQELIETVERDAGSAAPLELLATASSTVAGLEEVGDALLGHFVDRCRRGGHSWSEISAALGVSKQAAHKRFTLPAPTLERLTVRARNTLDAATAAARRLGHNYVGTEHLLLGLFAEPQGLAALVLAEAGVTPAAVEEKVLDVLPRGTLLLESPPYIPQASQALQAALEEALRLRHNYIGTEHILLGLVRSRDWLAGRILTDLGLTQEQTQARIGQMIAEVMKAKGVQP
ncbi:MAG TPA: Clp protease N-terminal domain-containing protein [Acidimicrobiia bacterium]|nr:Clp protease N-terminal domain-containing protein [Acidimicrobiia bacterium]